MRDPRPRLTIISTLAIQKDCNSAVSRNHCEIYVVVYEPSVNHIYVRDRKSLNGTYVNGKLIGIGPNISPGYLLEHGDIIEIRPHWKFTLIQSKQPPCFDMTGLQQIECRVSVRG